MIGMIANILLGLFLILIFYRSRAKLKNLLIKEWLYYLIGLFVSISICLAVIKLGKFVTNEVSVSWIRYFIQLIFIIIGLLFASFIFEKVLPDKLKEFYNLKKKT